MGFVADEFTGRTIGRYQLLCRLAVGGMAEIFLGFTKKGPTSFKPVVIKRILPESREDESALQALIDEAKITATLSHTNVAQVLDLEMAGEEVLLVIEFIRGATLEEIAQVYTDRKEPVPLGFVLAAMKDCALGINNAHGHRDAKGNPQPIIHRDVTPKNLMVDFDGVGKVLDFGIARAAGAARRTVAGMVRGTSAYMSPEQAIDSKIDTRTDLFSLGVIFHELLTGQRLFYKGNAAKEMAAVYEQDIPLPSTVTRRVPAALDKVVMKALERPMGKRYQNGLDLVRDLQLAAGSTIWAPDRCAELVRTRFSQRRQEILALVTKMSEDEGPSISTEPGRPTYSPTQSGAPQLEPSTLIVNKPATNNKPTERGKIDTDESASPTKFFKPEFSDSGSVHKIAPHNNTLRLDGQNAPKMPSVRQLPPVPKNASRGNLLPTPEPLGPVPVDDQPTPLPMTQSGITPGPQDSQSSGDYPAEIPTDSDREAVRRATNFSETLDDSLPPRRMAPQQQSQRQQKSGVSAGAIVLAAIAALVVGGLGGAVLYRALSATPSTQVAGVGRVTIGTDRPAEVWLGSQSLGQTPLVDLWLPAGVHHFRLKETDGSARSLDVEVAPNGVWKTPVKLDTLPKVP